MGSRTISIDMTNRTGVTLDFGAAESTEGPVATVTATSVADGASLIATAKNSGLTYYGNEGTFGMSGGSLSYTVSYTHPAGLGSTKVQVSGTGGGVGGANALTYSGDPVNATMNLYSGVAVPATDSSGNGVTGYAVPLFEGAYKHANNIQDFVNSLYGDNMRQESTIAGTFNLKNSVIADFTGQMMSELLPQLMHAWKDATGPSPSATNVDAPILQFLADYLVPPMPTGQTQTQINMWVPDLTYQAGTSPSVYALTGYTNAGDFQTAGAWNEEAIEAFLGLLLGGAHFVAISATEDFANQNEMSVPTAANTSWPDLDLMFRETDLPHRHDNGNSHYHGTVAFVNETGSYYLDVNEDFAPQGCGYLLSLLFGHTVNAVSAKTGTYNTFMQLEGWQANGVSKTTRHMLDFQTYEDTLWNISTYGACPFSEKRATTVFLAPAGWTPQVYQTTRMMPYVGAYAADAYPNGTPQGWLNTGLVTISSDATALPACYYAN